MGAIRASTAISMTAIDAVPVCVREEGAFNALLNDPSVPEHERTRHQGHRGADRHRGRDDPHVGAALRVPRARSARRAATGATRRADVEALRRVQAYRHRGLSVPAGDRARARELRRDRPPVDLRGRRLGRQRPAPAGAAQVDARSRSAARSSTRRSPAPRRPCSSAPSSTSRFYRAVEPRYRRLARFADAAVVFADFARRAQAARRPGRDPDRRGRRAGQRVGRRHRRSRLRRLPARVGAARRRPSRATRTTSTGASRRSGRSDPSRDAACRDGRARLAARVDPEYGERLEQLLADRPMALEEPAPGADRADEPRSSPTSKPR